ARGQRAVRAGDLDQRIDLRQADVIVVAHTVLGGGEQLAQAGRVARAQRLGGQPDARVLAHDVPAAPAYGLGQVLFDAGQVGRLHVAQGAQLWKVALQQAH